MAEENSQETTQTIETEQPHGEQEVDIKAELERVMAELEKSKAESRKWEKRAKTNKDAAEKLEQTEQQGKTVEERVAALEAENQKLKAEKARSEAVKEVAKATGIAETVIAYMQGETVDELMQAATAVKSSLKVYPVVPQGTHPNPAAVTKESIEAIENPLERVRARAQNIELYK